MSRDRERAAALALLALLALVSLLSARQLSLCGRDQPAVRAALSVRVQVQDKDEPPGLRVAEDRFEAAAESPGLRVAEDRFEAEGEPPGLRVADDRFEAEADVLDGEAGSFDSFDSSDSADAEAEIEAASAEFEAEAEAESLDDPDSELPGPGDSASGSSFSAPEEDALRIEPDVKFRARARACVLHDRYGAFESGYIAAGLPLYGFLHIWKRFFWTNKYWPRPPVWKLFQACSVFHAPATFEGREVPPGSLNAAFGASNQCIAGPKDDQMECRDLYARAHGCSLNELRVMPRSYSLKTARSAAAFSREVLEEPGLRDAWWLVKATNMDAHGRGQVMMSPEETRAWASRPGGVGPRKQIATRYIDRPALYQGRKIDLRTYALVARAEPLVVFYADGLVRVADIQQELSPNMDLRAAITNLGSQEDELNKISFGKADSLSLLPFEPGFLSGRFRKQASASMLFALQALRHSPAFRRQSTVRRFHVYAFDWAVDASGSAWLLEGNSFPSLTAEVLNKTHRASAAELAVLLHSRPERLLLRGSWEELTVKNGFAFKDTWHLIYNELEERREGRLPWNPCQQRELRDANATAGSS